MKIKYLKLKNFRGYAEETEINFGDLTVLVGKNDVGKSTILEALDIFFNDGNGAVKMDRTDLNNLAARENNNEMVITACFSEVADLEVGIDSTVETKLADEYMLNSAGDLEVVKKFKNGGKASVFIRAIHPTNPECQDLLLKKNTELRRIISSHGIQCENQTVNRVMRRDIWKHFEPNLELQEVEIDASKEDARKIWDKLAVYMPTYSLFQADRKNSDGDSEVQDPLKEAVKEIINDKELQQTLTKVANTVETKLKEVSDRTLAKLREMAPDVANTLNPVIPTADKLKWADVFKSVSIAGDEDIPINKRGSGVKRLVLLNFFRAEAERRAAERHNEGIIYAIEEPETSQHPGNQRILVRALKALSQAVNTQVILTTHSPFIVKELDFTNLRLVCEADGRKRALPVDRTILRYPSLNEVNFLAYDEVSEGYHDELYGYLCYRGWFDDYKQDRPKRPYVKQNRNGASRPTDIDLTEYIRHQIHHPENKHNTPFTPKELRQSIVDMREYISDRLSSEGLEDADSSEE